MKKQITIIIAVLILVLVGAFFARRSTPSGVYDTFATCLKDSGATFYGAFWCPHCREQKGMFGNSVKYIPYVECSTPDGQSQLAVCKEKGVTSYPTWIFANGSTTTGTLPLKELSEKTGCPLPQ